ncbi:MAG: MFS transporter [Dehalococcoidia bacterium]
MAATGTPSEKRQGMRLPQTFSAFRIAAFRYLWVSSVLTTTAMQVQMFARGLLAYELGGSAASIGLVTLGQAIPQLMFSMLGGTFADRIDRRMMMVWVQAFKSVIAVLITLMVLADVMTVTYLFAFGLVQGVIISFGGPARQAFVPEVVGKKELMNAMALSNAAMNLSRIGAPSLAAAIVAISWADIAGIYVFQMLLDVVALGLLFFLPAMAKGQMKAADRDPEDAQVRRQRKPTSARVILAEIREGFRYIFASPILLTLAGIGLVPTLLGQSHQQMLPVFAKDVFGDGIDRNAGALGFMGTMSGVGALVGSLLVASMAEYKRRTLLQLGSGLGYGLFLAAFAVQNNFTAAVIMLVGVGFSSAFLQSLNSTMLMTVSDPAYHGRVMSVNMLTFSLTSVGVFVMGYVIDYIGGWTIGSLTIGPVQVAYFVSGLLIAAFILATTVFNPSYRRLEQSDLRRYSESSTNREQVAVGGD